MTFELIVFGVRVMGRLQGLKDELGSMEMEADAINCSLEIPGKGRKETNRMLMRWAGEWVHIDR